MKKSCWLAKQYKRGWRLGYCIGNEKPFYLPLWFKDENIEKYIKIMLKENIVFVHMGETR